MTEIYDLWNALWHDAWATWDGLWLFQINQMPIDRALGSVDPCTPSGLTATPPGRPAVIPLLASRRHPRSASTV